MSTFTYTGKLQATECCVCGMQFAVPENWLEKKRENGSGFHCPNGHSLAYNESETEKLRKQLDAETARRKRAEDAAAQHEQAAIDLGAKMVRVKRRLAGGKCPCCKRNFTSLRRHMATKHPEFGKPTP